MYYCGSKKQLTGRIDAEDNFSHRIALSVKHLPERIKGLCLDALEDNIGKLAVSEGSNELCDLDPHPWACCAEFDMGSWRALETGDLVFGPDGLVSVRRSRREFDVINWKDGAWACDASAPVR